MNNVFTSAKCKRDSFQTFQRILCFKALKQDVPQKEHNCWKHQKKWVKKSVFMCLALLVEFYSLSCSSKTFLSSMDHKGIICRTITVLIFFYTIFGQKQMQDILALDGNYFHIIILKVIICSNIQPIINKVPIYYASLSLGGMRMSTFSLLSELFL